MKNGTQYVTKEVPWNPGAKGFYWDGKTMIKITIRENAPRCKDGYDTYECTEDPSEEDKYLFYTVKHRDLFSITAENDKRLLQNALYNEIVKKMDVTYVNETKFLKLCSESE